MITKYLESIFTLRNLNRQLIVYQKPDSNNSVCLGTIEYIWIVSDVLWLLVKINWSVVNNNKISVCLYSIELNNAKILFILFYKMCIWSKSEVFWFIFVDHWWQIGLNDPSNRHIDWPAKLRTVNAYGHCLNLKVINAFEINRNYSISHQFKEHFFV